jgi:hypothetical protein
MWVFNITSRSFRYLLGPNATNQNGMVGGVPRLPGSRLRATAFSLPGAYPDNLFLMAGGGYTVDSGGSGKLNDVWEYDIIPNQWKYLR